MTRISRAARRVPTPARAGRRAATTAKTMLASAAVAVPLTFGSSAGAEPVRIAHTEAVASTTTEVTTTTGAAVTTTTAPATTTTTAPVTATTTMIGAALSDQSTVSLGLTVQPVSTGSLPRTGRSSRAATYLGLALVGVGALASRARRRRFYSRPTGA